MRTPKRTLIRTLAQHDPPVISKAFSQINWNKPVSQYEIYLSEQTRGTRSVLVAETEGEFSGYATVNWNPKYQPFTDSGIPEIQDFNVLPHFRRQGIGTCLMDKAEEMVAAKAAKVGIGVGLYPD